MAIAPAIPNKLRTQVLSGLKDAVINFQNGNDINSGMLLKGGINGTRLDNIIISHKGTNAATKLFIYLNNGGDYLAVPDNNIMIHQLDIPANEDNTTKLSSIHSFFIDVVIPKNYCLLFGLKTAVVSGFDITAFGSDY